MNPPLRTPSSDPPNVSKIGNLHELAAPKWECMWALTVIMGFSMQHGLVAQQVVLSNLSQLVKGEYLIRIMR